MSEARRQRRAFKRAFDKATKVNSIKKPTLTSTSLFDGIPVGDLFKEEVDKILKNEIVEYESTDTNI